MNLSHSSQVLVSTLADGGAIPPRRPIADIFRRTATGAVRACLRLGIHPNTVSVFSLVAGLAAGLCFWRGGSEPLLLLPAMAFTGLRLWLNMLDGMVAVAGERCSPRGEVFNELPDRLSDLAIFLGVAHSALGQPFLAYGAALGALLVAYVGTLAQAVGGRRQFGGAMAKPSRMTLLILAAALYLGAGAYPIEPFSFAGFSVFDLALTTIILGSAQTCWVRLRALFRELPTHSSTNTAPGSHS